VEGAPGAEFAVYPQTPSHQLDELDGDRETQPRAAVLAAGGTLCLGKGLEDEPLLALGNLDTRIANSDTHADVIRRMRFHLNLDLDLSRLLASGWQTRPHS